MIKDIAKKLIESGELKINMSKNIAEQVEEVVMMILDCLKKGNKLLLCGNGGSAADAQHIAAEFVNRFKIERQPWPAIALTTDTSIITAISNDAGYEFIFSKQVEAIGGKDDILIVITTSDISFEDSGHSANIAKAIEVAKKRGLKIIGLVSEKSKLILKFLDSVLIVPHSDTPRIQEAHITLLHIICELVEKELVNIIK